MNFAPCKQYCTNNQESISQRRKKSFAESKEAINDKRRELYREKRDEFNKRRRDSYHENPMPKRKEVKEHYQANEDLIMQKRQETKDATGKSTRILRFRQSNLEGPNFNCHKCNGAEYRNGTTRLKVKVIQTQVIFLYFVYFVTVAFKIPGKKLYQT